MPCHLVFLKPGFLFWCFLVFWPVSISRLCLVHLIFFPRIDFSVLLISCLLEIVVTLEFLCHLVRVCDGSFFLLCFSV